MESLTKLWKLTIGHEKEFAKYVRFMCLDESCNGDIIAKKVSYIIDDFINKPPTFNDNRYFLNNTYANNVLKYIFAWFNDYNNNIAPNSLWAS
jgi:hypothetical protein